MRADTDNEIRVLNDCQQQKVRASDERGGRGEAAKLPLADPKNRLAELL
jgi:hypothetical protein